MAPMVVGYHQKCSPVGPKDAMQEAGFCGKTDPEQLTVASAKRFLGEAHQTSGDNWMYPYQRTPIGNPYVSPI